MPTTYIDPIEPNQPNFANTPDNFQTEEDILASTLGDYGNGLPSDDLYVTISRIRQDNGDYSTQIDVSRPVRRMYLAGLLSEAQWIANSLGCEYIEPYVIGEEYEDADIFDDLYD